MRKIKLGDVLDVQRGTSLSGEYYATSGDKIRLTLGNFKYPECGFKENSTKSDIYFTGKVKDNFIMKEGDIITPLTEQVRGLLGNTATIPVSNLYIQSGDIAKIIPDEKLLNKRFSYYLISSPIVKKQLDSASQQTKIRHTSPDKIKDCIAFVPEIDTQKQIASILDLLDSKISLNNKIISELESMAKTIYDYWFLQFEFPNEEGKPYKSSGGKMAWNEELKREVPEGWKITKIGTLCDIKRGISYNSSNMDMNGIPILSLASINRQGKYIPNGIKYFNGQYSNDKILKPYDMIMCNTDMTQEKEIIAKAILVPDIFENRDILSTHHISHVIFADETYKEYLYMTTQTPWFHNYIKGFSSGTNVLGLDVNGFKNYNLLIPSKEILHIFTKFIQNIEKQKSNLLKKNQELTSLRDFLLPLLMNGQVGFKKFDE